jgi:hypothetical protein
LALEPATLGPTPDRNKRFPTFRACGYNPTGFGAFDVLIFSDILEISYKYTDLNDVQNRFAIFSNSFLILFSQIFDRK